MSDEVPSMAPIGVERGQCELARAPRMRRIDGRPRERGVERRHDALAHLARRFARESHGDDLFRPFDPSQQREETLDQELGLSRSGGRLHETRSPGLERALPCAAASATRSAAARGSSGIAVLRVAIDRHYADPAQRLQTDTACRSRAHRAAQPQRHLREPPPPIASSVWRQRLSTARQSASPTVFDGRRLGQPWPGVAIRRETYGLHFTRPQLRVRDGADRLRETRNHAARANRARAGAPARDHRTTWPAPRPFRSCNR